MSLDQHALLGSLDWLVNIRTPYGTAGALAHFPKRQLMLARKYRGIVKCSPIAFDPDSTQAREQGHRVLRASARRLGS